MNHVREIQKTGPARYWWWIPEEVNVADLVMRGGSPELLEENSVWQVGPEFLFGPVKGWPMKSTSEVAADAREKVKNLQKKTFSAALSRAQAKKVLTFDSPDGEGSIDTDGVSGAPESSGNGMKLSPAKTKETEELWGIKLIDQEDPTCYSTLAKNCIPRSVPGHPGGSCVSCGNTKQTRCQQG